ncbi:MAG: hypothetical protein CEN87_346 [Parcubacteria group bacterium Licking1014_1]|nr:MAG: hypothetical protein CEN87_346 [Parcubacteria group bacterium Licking1014_1]
MSTIIELFSDKRRHDHFLIEEEEGVIRFTLTSCFYYDDGEWDIFSAAISKSDFVKAAEQFLAARFYDTDELKITENKDEGIYISAGKFEDIFSSHSGFVERTITGSVSIEKFIEMLKRMIGRNELAE